VDLTLLKSKYPEAGRPIPSRKAISELENASPQRQVCPSGINGIKGIIYVVNEVYLLQRSPQCLKASMKVLERV